MKYVNIRNEFVSPWVYIQWVCEAVSGSEINIPGAGHILLWLFKHSDTFQHCFHSKIKLYHLILKGHTETFQILLCNLMVENMDGH